METMAHRGGLGPLLARLHEESEAELVARARRQFRGDDAAFARLVSEYGDLAPQLRGRFLAAHGLSTEDDAEQRAEAAGPGLSLAVSPAMGDFLHGLALALRPERVLELGSSRGVSALYLAEALRTLGRGRLTATEMDPAKCRQFRAHLEEAGLGDRVELLEGDALATLTRLQGPFDLVFMDLAASLYLEAFRALEPLLRPGSVLLADNMHTAEAEVRGFRAHLEAHPKLRGRVLDFESGVAFYTVL